MKKFIAIILSMLCLVGLVACESGPTLVSSAAAEKVLSAYNKAEKVNMYKRYEYGKGQNGSSIGGSEMVKINDKIGYMIERKTIEKGVRSMCYTAHQYVLTITYLDENYMTSDNIKLTLAAQITHTFWPGESDDEFFSVMKAQTVEELLEKSSTKNVYLSRLVKMTLEGNNGSIYADAGLWKDMGPTVLEDGESLAMAYRGFKFAVIDSEGIADDDSYVGESVWTIKNGKYAKGEAPSDPIAYVNWLEREEIKQQMIDETYKYFHENDLPLLFY